MFSASPKHSYTKSLVLCVLACFLLTTLLLNATLTSILPGPFKLQPEKSYRKIILHVTKELKTIASIGGVGSVVAGLSQAQSKVYTDYDIWVVMPYYSFISQRTSQLFSVSVNHDGKQVTADLSYMKHDGVHIVFVGPGDKAPFDLLWQSSQTELYTTLYPLTFTHRDMFFSAAVFDLITYFQSTGELEIVHIHGSTNGMLPGMIAANFAPNQRPVTIYTLHDYVYEPDILLEPSITLEFPLAAQVVKSDQDLFYPCYHALKWADTITAVSDGMVQGILADEIPFLFRKIMLERFFYDDLVGIPNSIEPYLNPFKNQFLIDNGLAFSNHEPLLTTKQKAKDVLYPDILPSDSYPLVLFIGRLDVVKGVDTFESMAKLSRQLKFQFIVVGSCTLGQRANWDRIKSVILKYENVRVVDSPQDQQQYGLILRMAADFVFVPSKMESFGLVAVEACKYGAIPIVNNVPGLRTAINNYYKDNSPEKNEWTGFVFDKKSKPLERVMESALNELEGLKSEETEALLRRLINSHLDWEEGWETGQNSVAKYLNTYTTAAEKKNCINCTTQHNETDNLVANGSFDSDDVSKWWPYFDGYTSNFYDITMANVPCKDEYVYMGATQRIDLDHLNPKMALVSGWSRVDYVVLKHNDPSLYSLFVDVYYKDNSTRYGENAPFSIKPHTWEYKEIYLYFEKPVDFITVTCRFVSSCGIAYFDDISVVVK